MRPLYALLFLTAAFSLSAQQVAAPKLAIFWPDRIISKSARAHKLFAELDALRKPLEEKLQAKGLEGQKLQSQLNSNSISEAGKETLTKQLRDLEYDYKKLQEDSQADYGKVQKRVFGQFQTEIAPIVEAVSKEQKLQVVLQYQPGLVAYVEDAWLGAFNDEVAKRYDALPQPSAAPAGKAATPAAKPAPKK